ncbi:MAG: DUF1330 domain-containing protein [Pseudomonadota bacterium]
MVQVVASLSINPEEPEALETYFQVAMPLIERVGAKVVQKIEVGEAVVGEQPSEMVMLVEYPSYEAVQRVFNSAEYQAIIPAREKAFLKYNVCIVSKNDLTV